MPNKATHPVLKERLKWLCAIWFITSLLTGIEQIILHPHLPAAILASRTLLAPLWLLITPLLLAAVYEEWEPALFLYGGILLGLITWRIGRYFSTTPTQPSR